jgi:hypothetical protein
VNIWHNTAISNGNIAKKLAQFFIIPNNQLNVSWHNSFFLVVLAAFQPTPNPNYKNKNHTN